MNQMVQLVTATVLSNEILKIELMYEKLQKNEKLDICFVDNNNIFDGNYFYGDNIKILFNIPIKKGNFKLNINGKIENVRFVDNKNQKIIQVPNEYKIFTKEYVINILEEGTIGITEKKLLDKVKYEFKKQINSIKTRKKLAVLRLFKGKEKYYLFNDRLLYGDDNAEQLFRHINNKHKKIAKNCYFVLDKKAPCFKEIKKVGKVLKFGSLNHKIKYLNARMVVSSHSSYYDRIYNPYNAEEMEFYKDIMCKKFVFAQHGVIMNDVHSVLERPRTIADLFITTTKEEYKNVKDVKYLYEDNMVVCTGLPRFDKLVDKKENIILISPTWRAYLTNVEYTDDKGNDFLTSEYFKKYSSILKNTDLLNYLKENNYKIKFLLHPAFQEHKEHFIKFNNENIEIIFTEEIKYSELFNECSIFITDYSSIHFDVAFLKKPIIYYQFDKEKFFKSHYTKGYYDYEKDGFGEVIEEEEELIKKIKYYIKNNCELEEKYIEQINGTFEYLNRENSERVYREIINLDNKEEKVYRFNDVG